eukprot:717583-Pelagomonas_calceolata.AAC.6
MVPRLEQQPVAESVVGMGKAACCTFLLGAKSMQPIPKEDPGPGLLGPLPSEGCEQPGFTKRPPLGKSRLF